MIYGERQSELSSKKERKKEKNTYCRQISFLIMPNVQCTAEINLLSIFLAYGNGYVVRPAFRQMIDHFWEDFFGQLRNKIRNSRDSDIGEKYDIFCKLSHILL